MVKQSIMQCFQKTEIFLEIRDPTFYFWTFINVQKKKLRSIFVKFFQGVLDTLFLPGSIFGMIFLEVYLFMVRM